MSKPEDAPAEYIQVIVRRGHGEEEGHHGGVWKIAYADFMTAMMAFFLVMWLVNAANTEMKSSVASYFNPIKLSDNVIRKKGLLDVDGKANAEETSKTWANTPPGRSDLKSDKGEQVLSSDEGAPETDRAQQGLGDTPDKSISAAGSDGDAAKVGRASEAGRAFRDPFNPFAPGQLMSREGADRDTSKGSAPGAQPSPERLAASSPERPADAQGSAKSEPGSIGGQAASPAQGKAAAGSHSQGAAGEAREAATRGATASKSLAEQADGANAAARRLAASAAGILREIQAAAKPLLGEGGPGIEVTIEGNGIVLSLTDTSTFGMFAIGSADPSKQTIDLIARIAPVLAANSRSIVVRGHTDSRVYRSDRNNNWRLSTSRAEAAYAMLVRAGIDESRFTRIEGHADRKLKVPGDSEAAANRRIEILLQQRAE